MNISTGEVRRWDSLTPEQQTSGEWIKVPDGTEGGSARRATIADELFPQRPESEIRREVIEALNARFGC